MKKIILATGLLLGFVTTAMADEIVCVKKDTAEIAFGVKRPYCEGVTLSNPCPTKTWHETGTWHFGEDFPWRGPDVIFMRYDRDLPVTEKYKEFYMSLKIAMTPPDLEGRRKTVYGLGGIFVRKRHGKAGYSFHVDSIGGVEFNGKYNECDHRFRDCVTYPVTCSLR